MGEKLELAISHIKKGNKDRGREILIELLKEDNRNELAWLWMSKCATTLAQKKDCFERVLAINPNNKYAKQGLMRLRERSEKSHKRGEERETSRGKKMPKALVIAVVGALVSFCGFIFWLGTGSKVKCKDPSPERIVQIQSLLETINPNNQIGPVQEVDQTGNENFGWKGDYVAAQIVDPNGSTNKPIVGVWFLSNPGEDSASFWHHELNDAAKKYSNYSPFSRDISFSSNRLEKVRQCVLDQIKSNPVTARPKPTQNPGYLYKIPGLNYQDIVEHLEEIGLICESMKPVTEGHVKECHGEFDSGNVIVDVIVHSAENTDDIYIFDTFVDQYKSSNPNDKIAAEILGHVASIKFQESKHELMNRWVKRYISVEHKNDQETPQVLVGNVVFGLPCNIPEYRCLVVGRMPDLWTIEKRDIPQIQESDYIK